MPMTPKNTRTFHRRLYAGELQSITLLKRDDDQLEANVRKIDLYQCRRSRMLKKGEPIQNDISSDQNCLWHIPRIELDRTGVDHLNAADRIYDPVTGYTWQPESGQEIDRKMFGNMVNIKTVRIA